MEDTAAANIAGRRYFRTTGTAGSALYGYCCCCACAIVPRPSWLWLLYVLLPFRCGCRCTYIIQLVRVIFTPSVQRTLAVAAARILVVLYECDHISVCAQISYYDRSITAHVRDSYKTPPQLGLLPTTANYCQRCIRMYTACTE